MKVYRTIGTVLSSILTIILTVALFASFTVVSIAKAVNKNTVSEVTENILENETVSEEISSLIAPAVTETLTEALIFSATEEGSQTLTFITEDDVQKIMDTEEFRATYNEILSDCIRSLFGSLDEPFSCADKIETMFAENSGVFDSIINEILTKNQISYDTFYDTLDSYLTEPMPTRGASPSKLVACMIAERTTEINRVVQAQIPTEKEITRRITDVLLENEDFSKKLSSEISEILTVTVNYNGTDIPLITKEDIEIVMDSDIYQNALTETVSEYTKTILGEIDGETLNLSENFEEMVLENPEFFNDWLENILAEKDVSREIFYDAYTSSFQNENNIPEEDASYAELFAALIRDNADTVNDSAKKYIPSDEKLIESATNHMMEDETVFETIKTEFAAAMQFTVTEETIRDMEVITEEDITALLSMQAFKHTLGDLVSEYAFAILGQNESEIISCSAHIEAMFTENAAEFDPWIENILAKNQISKSFFRDAIAMIAQNPENLPDENASYSAYFAFLIAENGETIDSAVAEVLPVQTESTKETPTVSDETQKTLSMISEILAFFQSPIVYFIIAGIFIVFFLLFAILMWSFKRPNLLLSIGAILSGALLLILSSITIPYSLLEMEAAVSEVIDIVWTKLSASIFYHGLADLIIGILFCGIFILIQILFKKKKAAKTEASPEVPTEA